MIFMQKGKGIWNKLRKIIKKRKSKTTDREVRESGVRLTNGQYAFMVGLILEIYFHWGLDEFLYIIL